MATLAAGAVHARLVDEALDHLDEVAPARTVEGVLARVLDVSAPSRRLLLHGHRADQLRIGAAPVPQIEDFLVSIQPEL
jgi:hypothetical protein